MPFIDEAAREINVKVVWYAAEPGAAAAVRYVAERAAVRVNTFALDAGLTALVVQFAPPTLGKIRGFTVRFHLYAPDAGRIESDEARWLLFRGADGCVLVGGPGEEAALARIDAVLAAQLYSDVPIVFGASDTMAGDARSRGRALGFPEADVFSLDARSGEGVFAALKETARKILTLLAGRPVAGRPTPAPGTVPQTAPPRC